MLRLVPDQPAYRWGDLITVRYTGDPEDLVALAAVQGTIQPDGAEHGVPFAGSLTVGVTYSRPVLDGYWFDHEPADSSVWIGIPNAHPPSGAARTVTIVGAVTTLRGTAPVSCTVELAPRMAVGWAPGLRAGESAVMAIQRMLADYPVPSTVRIFIGAGEGLPSWTSGVLAAIPDTVRLIIVSIKDWRVDAAGWLSQMPEKFRGRIVLCLDHEPEQQDGGDPTPLQFRTEWAELVEALRGHARRSWILLAVVFTRYYWQRQPSAFDQFFPVEVLDGIDAVGWDIYDPDGGLIYETAESMLRTPLAIQARSGKPILIAELGIDRDSSDSTGEACVRSMRSMMAECGRLGVLAVCWFHKGVHDLTARGRTAERDALADLIEDAA